MPQLANKYIHVYTFGMICTGINTVFTFIKTRLTHSHGQAVAITISFIVIYPLVTRYLFLASYLVVDVYHLLSAKPIIMPTYVLQQLAKTVTITIVEEAHSQWKN